MSNIEENLNYFTVADFRRCISKNDLLYLIKIYWGTGKRQSTQ